jgi:hypothetical protein
MFGALMPGAPMLGAMLALASRFALQPTNAKPIPLLTTTQPMCVRIA